VKFDTRVDLTGDSGVVADLQPLEQAARLLGVSQELLETALVKKKSLVIRGECRGALPVPCFATLVSRPPKTKMCIDLARSLVCFMALLDVFSPLHNFPFPFPVCLQAKCLPSR
jgi:hypothetical protein